MDLVTPPTRLNASNASIDDDEPVAVETQFVSRNAAAEELPPSAPLPWNDAKLNVSRPSVVMSDAHRKSCKIFVGDTFPDLSLVTVNGDATQLAQQLTKHATLIVFWNGRFATNVGLVERLESEVLARHPNIHVIAIHTGRSNEAFRQISSADQSSPRLTHLADTDGSALADVATSMLPRSYLLDPQRKVVWLDIEYTRSMRRERSNAIRYLSVK